MPYSTTTLAGDIFGKCASKMSAELLMAIGMIGHFALVAILKLPSWNGSMSVSSAFLFRVPSGKMQMEMPDITFSTAVRMVFRPCLMSFLSRKRQ